MTDSTTTASALATRLQELRTRRPRRGEVKMLRETYGTAVDTIVMARKTGFRGVTVVRGNGGAASPGASKLCD